MANESEEGQGSQRAVVPVMVMMMMMMMMFLHIREYQQLSGLNLLVIGCRT
jgi:hypothetical protein